MGRHEYRTKKINDEKRSKMIPINNKYNKLLIAILVLVATIVAIGSILFGKDIIKFRNRKIIEFIGIQNRIAENSEAENTEQETKVLNSENQENNSNSTSQENNGETVKNSNELFGAFYKQAESLLETMSLEEKIGQMFLVRYPERGVIEEIKTQNPGGYILFGRDFDNETKTSMLEELNANQGASKIKLALGVDEEGGAVVRVSSHKAFRSSKFLSPQKLYSKGGLDLIVEDSKEKSELLKSIGLNMNLAPVSDVSTSSSDFIYKRAYGKGAEETAKYVAKLIETMNESGMISTMKHFPGYGNNVDTHTGIAIDERLYETFVNSDFLPFKAGIEAKGPTILVSHNVVKCMDESKPASLSENVHKILREDLGFSGIIMTDDLAMDAVKTYVENGEAAVQAVLAGNDMIISSDFTKQKNEVVLAVNDGRISQDIIDKAVKRILACKYAYKIIE